jgi:hypothetical protein
MGQKIDGRGGKMITETGDLFDDGGPAFPTNHLSSDNGMTLRDWFAGKAIALWNIDGKDLSQLEVGNKPNHELVAEFCYSLADAMIKERDTWKSK